MGPVFRGAWEESQWARDSRRKRSQEEAGEWRKQNRAGEEGPQDSMQAKSLSQPVLAGDSSESVLREARKMNSPTLLRVSLQLLGGRGGDAVGRDTSF